MSLIHPRKQTARAQFYPHVVTITALAGQQFTPQDGLINLPCAWQEARGGAPQTWQGEAPAGDTIMLMQHFPEIAPKMQAKLTITDANGNSRTRIYKIDDVFSDSHATQTTLAVSLAAK